MSILGYKITYVSYDIYISYVYVYIIYKIVLCYYILNTYTHGISQLSRYISYFSLMGLNLNNFELFLELVN